MNSKNLDTTTTVTSNAEPLGYSKFVFINEGRDYILDLLVPKYVRIFADHVVHDFGVSYNEYCQDSRVYSSAPSTMRFYGSIDSGDGKECYLVNIDGKDKRPDGRPYFITWSIIEDRCTTSEPWISQRKNFREITPIDMAVACTWEPFNKPK